MLPGNIQKRWVWSYVFLCSKYTTTFYFQIYIVYVKQMVPAFTMAFACASSAATLPVTIDCVVRSGAPVGIARFVLPLGATSKCRMLFLSWNYCVSACSHTPLNSTQLSQHGWVVYTDRMLLRVVGIPKWNYTNSCWLYSSCFLCHIR